MARDVLAVLDAAGVPRATVVGASLGGMIAQEVAIMDGARGRSLVPRLHDARLAVRLSDAGRDRGAARRDRPMPPEVGSAPARGELTRPDTVQRRPDLVDRLVANQRSRRGGAGGWYAQLAAGARFGDLRQGSITAPTLVMHGTEDRVVDPRNAGYWPTVSPTHGSRCCPDSATCSSGRPRTRSSMP
jgi:pimeloyl-ACP methyl ester carboxylesterase